jgi:hypothetical protein
LILDDETGEASLVVVTWREHDLSAQSVTVPVEPQCTFVAEFPSDELERGGAAQWAGILHRDGNGDSLASPGPRQTVAVDTRRGLVELH